MTRSEALAALLAKCERNRDFQYTVYVRKNELPEGSPLATLTFNKAVAYNLDPDWLGVATSIGAVEVFPVAEVSLWTGPSKD